MCLKAMELFEDGTEDWAVTTAAAFAVLKHPDCREMPKPEWWNEKALKALSARVVALAPDKIQPCSMRARVLSGANGLPWNVGPRTAAEIKEAATWYRRAAMVSLSPADKLAHEENARLCGAVADPFLAEEEAEAAKARAAAETKAKAVAEELLAEEEKEKQAASTKAGKAKQGKGKKGKGKR